MSVTLVGGALTWMCPRIVVIDNEVYHVEIFQDERVCGVSVDPRINCQWARREGCEHGWNFGCLICNIVYNGVIDILSVVGEIHRDGDKMVGGHNPQWCERNEIEILPVVIFLNNFGFRFRC